MKEVSLFSPLITTLLTLTMAICSIPSKTDLKQYALKGPHVVGIGAAAARSTSFSLFLLYLPKDTEVILLI